MKGPAEKSRILEALIETARQAMPARDFHRFEAELRVRFGTAARPSRKDLERDQLLRRHCPPALPPITIDQSGRAGRSGRRLKAKPRAPERSKQLRLL